jgi:hypothetical protein
LMRALGPVSGTTGEPNVPITRLAERLTAALAVTADERTRTSTPALVDPPSLPAFEHATRAFEMFFAHPADTAAVFAELTRASALDTSYSAPLLLRAYIDDVHEQWPALAREVAQLQTRSARLGRMERAILALLDADVRGDLLGRLGAARQLVQVSPGSVDLPLLHAISATYVNRPAEALAALSTTHPDHGINLLSPQYWMWRCEIEHLLGHGDDELRDARELARRFPNDSGAGP